MELNKEDYDKHINISDKQEVEKWSQKLNCKESDLIETVLKVSNRVKIVNDYLTLNRKKIKK